MLVNDVWHGSVKLLFSPVCGHLMTKWHCEPPLGEPMWACHKSFFPHQQQPLFRDAGCKTKLMRRVELEKYTQRIIQDKFLKKLHKQKGLCCCTLKYDGLMSLKENVVFKTVLGTTVLILVGWNERERKIAGSIPGIHLI